MSADSSDLTWREQVGAIYRAAMFRPWLTVGIIFFSVIAASLEGIGLGFLLPIVQLAQNPEAARQASGGELGIFVSVFEFLGVPFELGIVMLAVGTVFTIRYTSSFLVSWLRSLLAQNYMRYLQKKAYTRALNAEVAYFDEMGSDDILNTIVTEVTYARSTINGFTRLIEEGLLAAIYFFIAIYISPLLTIIAAVLLGFLTHAMRWAVESGSAVGDRVAEANQRIQETAQAGLQGIRDVKLFGIKEDLNNVYQKLVDERAVSEIKLKRNESAMSNFYDLITILTLLLIIYWGVVFSGLSLAALGVFLFAMFRLAPRTSTLNSFYYKLEGTIPHLYRTQQFLDELENRQEADDGRKSAPENIDEVVFDNVTFSYNSGEIVFENLSFSIGGDDFAAFVGPSGAGKSTIAALLSRMYEPDAGEIRADGTPITEFNIDEWRSDIAVVQQHPYIFNETLRWNVTIADQDATQREIERVCEIAQVTEFLDELPDGYDTKLGEDGVRLSGGQKQRVALARALLKDAELLVLDEATSDLDANIEEAVHRAIEEMDRDYAMLVIAHRLSTVINADCIYVVEDGEIVESGTHDKLIMSDGPYSNLYETQTQSV